MNKISKIIKERIDIDNKFCEASSNISKWIHDGELELLEKEVEERCKDLLDSLIIDREFDDNSKDTPRRLAKMFVHEIFKGRYCPMPKITEFPNYKKIDDIYILENISIRSTCSHHFAPIIGNVNIGIIPKDKLMGISKFCRLVDWIFSRPQIQEEACNQLMNLLIEQIKPQGAIIHIKATHYCMKWRGVKENNCVMHSISSRGLFREIESLEHKFLNMVER